MKEAFFEISQKDLKASKLLFKNKLYPQAVFYLQQSVEKATKSFGILNEIITLEEARYDVGHDSLKIYKKMMKSLQKEMEYFEEIINKNPRLGKNKIVEDITSNFSSKKMREYLNSLNDMDNKRVYNFPSKKDIESSIKLLDIIESKLGKSSLPSILTKQKLEESVKNMEEPLDTFSELDPEIVDQVKNGVNELLAPDSRNVILGIGEFWMDLLYVLFSLFLLSYLLPWYHAIYTKYPDEKGQNPREIYNEEHPLIRFYDDLVKIMEKTLSKMGNLFFKEANRERVKW
jgi:HEPN domain-containing protein